MTAASAAALRFRQMIEAGAAASIKESLSLVVWLLDEKGADVNGTMADGTSAFHAAGSLDILTALLDRGADPTLAGNNAVAPSYLQGRVAQGQPLPQVALIPVTGGHNEDVDETGEEEDRKLRTLIAFLLGMEGGWKNAGMPRDVLWVVFDLLMPSWDPLRR